MKNQAYAMFFLILAVGVASGGFFLSFPQRIHSEQEHIMEQHDQRNRLQFEKSPYLLQHADNPVDWYPWGNEAFEKARQENKPIFLSIGYSTCHWCHVMEHESFEDSEVARLMNEAFVSIKVDREERPDIDSMYMTVAQLMTGSGGWPLTIVMTPEKKPFFAGTYFSKTSRFGRIGMLELVPRIQALWTNEHEKVLQTADNIVNALQQSAQTLTTQAHSGEDAHTGILDAAYRQLATRFDQEYGGFGEAPKFPSPHTLLSLLRHWKRHGDQAALAMVEHTLQAMRLGGVYDHIGFGFHRYSTDRRWLLPHFEKMLYDQALLAMAYIETYQATGNEDYRQTACEIFTYVLRDMTAPEGGFYSAEDADSEGVEGKFYVWSVEEIRHILPEADADFATDLFHFEEEGNFRDQASGLKTGENIVHLQQSLAKNADALGITKQTLQDRLEGIRQQLFTIREERIHPHKDDKMLTDWNGLMIAALAKGAQAFDEPKYAEAAKQAAAFILSTMRTEDGRLLHRYRDNDAAIAAHLDDYAFFIWGLIELYETTFDVTYLKEAIALNDITARDFWDEEHGGFFFTADDAEKLLIREKNIYDGAVPSGNSAMMLNLVRLGRLLASPELEERADRIFRAFAGTVMKMPSVHTLLLLGIDLGIGPSHEIVIVGNTDAEDTQHMLQALRSVFSPNKVVVFRPPSEEESPEITTLAPYIEPYTQLNGTATAYVCQNYICALPTTDIQEMLDLLHKKEGDLLNIPGS